ncbi:unnamed protein product [Trichobilharzia regenti]|nr:unnamed protein product [Trichobilharzia regenti]
MSSLNERDLTPTKSWGDHITFDCDAVMAGTDGSLDNLIYNWEFISNNIINSNNNNNNNLRSSGQSSSSLGGISVDGSDSTGILHRQRLLIRTPSIASSSISTNNNNNNKLDLSQFHESQLRIDKLTLDHNGEYRCAVKTITPMSTNQLSSPMVITRSFRLTVKYRQIDRFKSQTIENLCQNYFNP